MRPWLPIANDAAAGPALKPGRAWLALLVSTALAACAGRAAGCSTRVIVSFAAPVKGTPDASFVGAVAASARVNLTYVRSMTPELHVFLLTTGSGCEEALGRLRSDSRIRSVDIDERRRPQ